MSASNNFPGIRPSLNLDFANTKQLDPRITFSRASTATYYDQFGVLQTAPAGVPRFDHDPVTGESLGFLIEEQRDNLLTYSADLTNAAWTKTGATATGDTVIAPDGTLTADALVEDTTTGEHRALVNNVAKSASAVMTLSVYVKPAGRYVVLVLEYSGTGLYTTFDVLTNQYWDFSADTGWTRGQTVITSVGNGWYRCSISGTTSADLTVTSRIQLASVAGFNKNASYTGNGTSGIYIWGAQLEVGAFPTSYIPTVASQVTRSADAASMTGTNFSSWYRADEGCFIANWKGGRTSQPNENDYRVGPVGMNGSNANFWLALNGSALSMGTWFGGGSPNFYFAAPNFVSVGGIMGVTYSSVGVVLAAGASVSTNSTAITTMPTCTSMDIGTRGASSRINGTIKRIAYYPKRLSNTELQSLTG